MGLKTKARGKSVLRAFHRSDGKNSAPLGGRSDSSQQRALADIRGEFAKLLASEPDADSRGRTNERVTSGQFVRDRPRLCENSGNDYRDELCREI